jgi:hypothetical protein
MRRCPTGESCGIGQAARVAFLDLPVVDLLSRPKHDWELFTSSIRQRGRTAAHAININWQQYPPEEFMFSHCSIVSSVATDETRYRIVPPCDELVNINGNAWTNHVIPHCFRTFVGGENYYEHVQVKAKSKGKILDAVLRPVTYVGKNGAKADVYYCDILIATARKHRDIVSRVESGSLNTLSMGAIANKCQCSYCGKITDENTPNCFHLDNSVRQYLRASDGKRYIVSELCGAVDAAGLYIPDSCMFIEASWVDNPAFPGAVVNYLIDLPAQSTVNASVAVATPDFPEIWFNPTGLQNLRVADISTMVAIRLAIKELRADKYRQIVARIAADYGR